MYRFLLYTISFFASLPYLQAAPVAQQDWDQLIWPGGGQTPCQNFQFMSMGALEVYNHNKFPIYLYWYYAGQSNDLYHLSNNNEKLIIEPGESIKFSRDSAAMKWMKRDTDIRLGADFVLEGDDQMALIPGIFRVPSAGKKQWAARVDVIPNKCKTIIDCNRLLFDRASATCKVDRQIRDASTP